MQLSARAPTAVAAAALLTATMGVGTAMAADEAESTGSLSSSDLDLAGTIGDLAVAAEALNGPVTVTPNADGGATVTYTNGLTETTECVGFTAPYSTIVESDLDAGYDKTSMAAALAFLSGIEAGPGVSLLLADDEGETFVKPEDPAIESDVTLAIVDLLYQYNGLNPAPESAFVEPGETVSWTTAEPDSPAVAGLVCIAGEVTEDSEMLTYFGIDPQVVADQINDKIPGGSLDVVGAGSISGGSVGAGAGMLGSLAPSDEE